MTGSIDGVDDEGQEEKQMFVKFPMILAKCLKYLCLASKRVVQWFMRGPYLSETHVECVCNSTAYKMVITQNARALPLY